MDPSEARIQVSFSDEIRESSMESSQAKNKQSSTYTIMMQLE